MSDCPLISNLCACTFALAVPLWLVIAGARLLLSEQFLQFEYRRPGFPADPYGFDIEDRLDYGPFADQLSI